MAQYEVEVTPKAGAVRDGDVRMIATVTLWRYDKPTSKGVKAGSTLVRAWTKRRLDHLGQEAGKDLMRRDKAKRKAEIENRIERIEEHRVSLIKKSRVHIERE